MFTPCYLLVVLMCLTPPQGLRARRWRPIVWQDQKRLALQRLEWLSGNLTEPKKWTHPCIFHFSDPVPAIYDYMDTQEAKCLQTRNDTECVEGWNELLTTIEVEFVVLREQCNYGAN